MSEALIIGAGISGLAAGWAFRRAHAPARILEAGDRPGGRVRTVRRDGFCLESGPHAVRGSPELFALAEAAGLDERLVVASGRHLKRYLVHDGRLVALPAGLREAWSSPIISKKGLLRCLSEPMRRRGPGPHESVTRFVERRLGKEAARLADALVLSVFAGDPDELAMGYAFPDVYRMESERGLLRGVLARRSEDASAAAGSAWTGPELVSCRQGLAEMVDALASELDVACRHEVTRIVPADGGFAVRGRSPEGEFELRCERVVSTLPVAAAAGVLSGLGTTQPLERVPEAPVAILNLGFERGQVRHALDGFGFFSPHQEDRMLLGCLFSSTLFPDRAPEGHVALTVMAGGRRRRDEVELPDSALVERVLYELETLLGVEGAPGVSEITRWQPGIAQATARTGEALEAVRSIERAHPGLTVLGGRLRGAGFSACVKAGWNLAV